ncbi:MAG: 4-alpha-glucanotransferase, partial [Prevotella sp.]
MKLLFHVNYQTVFGEELLVNLLHDGADEKTACQYRMATANGWDWDCEINVDNDTDTLEYYYSIECGQEQKRVEWQGHHHLLETNNGRGLYRLYDRWTDMPADSFRYSSAFTECLNRHVLARPESKGFGKTLRLKVCAPQLRSYESLYVLGNTNSLGAWKWSDAVAMTQHSINEWVVDVDASDMAGKMVEFKFVAIDKRHNNRMWETRNNRELVLPTLRDGDLVCYEEGVAYFDIYDVRCAGTLVPVFSLRSKKSFGVGDFGDLRMMVDWVAQTRQRVLQVLPINDTTTTHTWTDSYPYSCISIFALHPQYADLRSLPQLANKADRERFEKIRQELNALPQIDYEKVNNAKTEYLHKLYEQEGATTLAGKAFKLFFDENKSWLVPYAEYCSLRDTTGTYDFSQWKGHELWSEADRKALETAGSDEYNKVAFYYYVQFILSSQMREVHDYARSKGIILKGDIPIGVNRNGCDVWSEPRYFNLDSQAGAPPDDFSVNGQNWGFPTYNWDEMLKDDCAWWVRRFRNMQKY